MARTPPPEVLLSIISLLSNNDKYAVSQASTIFYLIATPLIWRVVTVSQPSKVVKFLDSALDPECKQASRIRSLDIVLRELLSPNQRNVDSTERTRLFDAIREHLPKAISRMDHLECFRLFIESEPLNFPTIITSLSTISTLKSLRCFTPWCTLDDMEKASLPRVHFPNLETLHLAVVDGSPQSSILEWIGHLVHDNAPRICDLQLDDGQYRGLLLDKMIPDQVCWPSLETLRMTHRGFYQPFVLNMPRVKKVIIPLSIWVDFIPHLIPSSHFPELEMVRGMSATLLHSGLLQGRPIHTLELDGVTFEDDKIEAGEPPILIAWPENFQLLMVFHQLTVPATPLRSLAFAIREFDVKLLRSILQPLSALEHLRISIGRDWWQSSLPEFGSQILASMPQLKTLQFDDGLRVLQGTGHFARVRDDVALQLQVLETWKKDRYCPLLRRAAFTCLFAWDKVDDRWAIESAGFAGM